MSAVDGMARLRRMSRSTSPGPTDGSWSGSPTRRTCAPSSTAATRAAASHVSHIDTSSQTTRSCGSFSSQPYRNTNPPPGTGRASSSLWTVVAGRPTSSSIRLAARPVGAHSATLRSASSAARTTSWTVRVLPVPGPPVSTDTDVANT